MAKYCKSILEILQEEDKLLIQREEIANKITNRLYDYDEIFPAEAAAIDEDVKRLKAIEKNILEKIESNRKDLKRRLINLFND